MLDTSTVALRLGMALGLGLLMGLERERAQEPHSMFGGVRTYPLIALLGGLSAFLHVELHLPVLPAVAFGAVAALIVVSYAATAGRGEFGLTSEVSALLAFWIGALCAFGYLQLASAATVASLVLLTLKDWLHALARRVEAADVEATLKFAIITVIALPLLPNRDFGPPNLEVINPYEIWLMVVLIAGLNFAGYILVKVLGAEHGLGLTGVLGGLISSTAVTLGFAQRSRDDPQHGPAFALGILLAWTVMFVRVVVMVAVVNRALARELVAPMGFMALASVAVCLWFWRRGRTQERGSIALGANPFELGEAIRFGLLFGLVTFVAKAADVHLGDAGLYLAGAVAGLTDVDAISLSMAKLAAGRPESLGAAARTVVIAVLSNTALKAGMAAWIGAPLLRRSIVPAAAALVTVCLGTLLFASR